MPGDWPLHHKNNTYTTGADPVTLTPTRLADFECRQAPALNLTASLRIQVPKSCTPSNPTVLHPHVRDGNVPPTTEICMPARPFARIPFSHTPAPPWQRTSGTSGTHCSRIGVRRQKSSSRKICANWKRQSWSHKFLRSRPTTESLASRARSEERMKLEHNQGAEGQAGRKG
jgi:hypothetical protein